MKTILFIAHSTDFYGADKVLFQVIEAARGVYDTHVVLPGPGDMARRLETFPDVGLHELSLPRFSLKTGDIAANLLSFAPFLLSFRKLLSRIDPALVYGNTIRSALPVAIARRLGYRTLVHFHECNPPGSSGRLLARLAATAADRNIFVCRFAMESYTLRMPGLEHRSVVIYNGLPGQSSPGSQNGLPVFEGGSPRLLSVGQLAPHKRIGDLLEAMPAILEEFPAARLVVLGDGELRGSLERRRRELGLDERVFLPGYVNDISPYLAEADIFLAPFAKEACNMAVLEAMAAGKPVVAANGGGMPELVAEGETGLTYSPGDIAALIDRTRQLAAAPDFRRALGDAARERARNLFNLPAQMDRVLVEIERLLSPGAH